MDFTYSFERTRNMWNSPKLAVRRRSSSGTLAHRPCCSCCPEDGDSILTVGHSPDADQAWISAILAIRLPMYPKLRIQLISEFSRELVRSVMAGDLNLALVTAPPESSRITAAAFAQTRFYAALPLTHSAAQKEDIRLQDFARRVDLVCSASSSNHL